MVTARTYRISVAMCTYNGERYLPEQLRSILAQTRLPDELIVCDDGSTDGTLAILHGFASAAPFPVEVVRAEVRLGSTANFEKAMRLCTGDVIALSDQDDIWAPHRLEASLAALTASDDTGMIFSDAAILDGSGAETGESLWSSFGFTADGQRALAAGDYTVALSSRVATGATMMLRRKLRDQVLPVGVGWIHDEWIAAAAPLFARVHAVNGKFIGYRRHGAQQVGPGSAALPRISLWMRLRNAGLAATSDRLRYEQLLVQAQNLVTTFSTGAHPGLHPERLERYRRVVDYFALRLQLPASRLLRVRSILMKPGTYFAFAGPARLVKDLLLPRLWRDA